MILIGRYKTQSSKKLCECVYVCVCIKWLQKLQKETWGKCGIKTLIYHNEEEEINELRHKMSDTEIQLGHPNIADVVLKIIQKYCGKKNKRHYRRRKTKIQSIF